MNKFELAHLNVGDRVETTTTVAADTDAGMVVEIQMADAEVYVAWDSGVRTWINAADIRIPA